MRADALDRLEWDSALAALQSRYTVDPSVRGVLADCASLSALFEPNLSKCTDRIIEARRFEPLNPLHLLRYILLAMRFGQWDEARNKLEELKSITGDHPLPTYLRALTYLREGEYNRAKTVVTELVDAHPAHVPGRFLQTEVLLNFKFKGTEKNLDSLPRGPELEAAWTDLLIKIVIKHPVDGAKLARKYLDRLRAGSPAERAVKRMLELVGAVQAAAHENGNGPAADTQIFVDIDQALLELDAGSREEQLVLLFFQRYLAAKKEEPEQLKILRALHLRLPDRATVRRLYVAALTRFAVGAAGRNEYREALRAVEVCVRLEPHETVHLQNRAALFTLMRDKGMYHDAWADLDRHHYRLALLGRLDAGNARAMAKPHRMHAQTARLTPQDPDPNLGIFVEEKQDDGTKRLTVNQSRIDGDPELLRQWIHHRRAELIFEHLALGTTAERALLRPEDAASAKARANALTEAGESLAVLVPDEGEKLAAELARRWASVAAEVGTSYVVRDADAQTAALERAHLSTFADLAVLCSTWSPDARATDVAEELLEMLATESPFFDDRLLFTLIDAREAEPQLSLLAFLVRSVLEIKDHEKSPVLGPFERMKVTKHLESSLLLSLSLACVRSSDRRDGLERALDLIDRARTASPDNPRIELLGARLLIAGEFLDEARAAISRFHKIAGNRPTESQKEEIEELQQLLDKAKKDGSNRKRGPGRAREAGAEGRESARVDELERHLEQFPSSIETHEDLAYALCAELRVDAALEWTERAIGQCLKRENQLRARALNLTVAGLKTLATDHPSAVKLYAAGTNGPLLEVIDALPPDGRHYAVEYLHGLCLLDAKKRPEAQAAFARALAGCSRQLHLAVLRPLAADIEQELLERARRSIRDALREERLEDANRELAATMRELSSPEPLLIELARIHLAGAIAGMSAQPVPLPMPQVTGREWSAKLAAAGRKERPLDRTRALAELAAEVHAGSAKESESVLAKIETLEEQLRIAQLLADSGKLLREGKWQESLALLQNSDAKDPRIARQRVLLLLKLEKFDDAEREMEAIGSSSDPVAKEMADRYPGLRFQHRIAAFNRLLRSGDTAAASSVLAATSASGDAELLELAYCRGFILAQESQALIAAGDFAGAKRTLASALDAMSERLPQARQVQHPRFVDLYTRIEKNLTDLEAKS